MPENNYMESRRPKIYKIACGVKHGLMIDSTHNVCPFGSNYYGQLGFDDCQEQARVRQIPNLKAWKVSY